MQKILLAVLLLMGSTLAAAQTADELLNDGKNTENVLSFGQNPKLQMYSPLRQINKSNVKRLVPLWSWDDRLSPGATVRRAELGRRLFAFHCQLRTCAVQIASR